MFYLPNEIARKIWANLYPTRELINNQINNDQLGTSVNNIFKNQNYCQTCGEINDINICIHCNVIIYLLCKKCKHTMINYDICCIDTYRDNLE
jgi:hypothetical protein